jgi:hypothetical protein
MGRRPGPGVDHPPLGGVAIEQHHRARPAVGPGRAWWVIPRVAWSIALTAEDDTTLCIAALSISLAI